MNLKEKLLSELEKRPDGMENRDLQSVFGEDYQNLVVIIQELINEKRIHVLQGPDGYVFQLSTTEEIQKQTRLEELGDEDMIVYQCIEASGDQGIWIRDIKVQTSLHASTINRAIEKMVKRKLIKSFKSIASKMKIMYILFDKELPKDITGGPWYVEQEFDLEFISVMSKFVQKVLREDEYGLDTKEILRRVTLSNISNVHILRRTVRPLHSTPLGDRHSPAAEQDELRQPDRRGVRSEGRKGVAAARGNDYL